MAVIGTFTDCQVSVARDAIDSEHRRVITKGSSSRCGPLFINVVHYRVAEHSSAETERKLRPDEFCLNVEENLVQFEISQFPNFEFVF